APTRSYDELPEVTTSYPSSIDPEETARILREHLRLVRGREVRPLHPGHEKRDVKPRVVAGEHHAIRPPELQGELEVQGPGRHGVRPHGPQVFAGRFPDLLRAAPQGRHLVVDPGDEVRQRPPRVREDHAQP